MFLKSAFTFPGVATNLKPSTQTHNQLAEKDDFILRFGCWSPHSWKPLWIDERGVRWPDNPNQALFSELYFFRDLRVITPRYRESQLSIVFFKVKVFVLRESAYANYADCCFHCRTDYANTLLPSCCLRGLRGILGLLTILCSTNLFFHKTYQLRRLRGRDYYRCLRETTPKLRPAGKRLREHSCSFTSIIALT